MGFRAINPNPNSITTAKKEIQIGVQAQQEATTGQGAGARPVHGRDRRGELRHLADCRDGPRQTNTHHDATGPAEVHEHGQAHLLLAGRQEPCDCAVRDAAALQQSDEEAQDEPHIVASDPGEVEDVRHDQREASSKERANDDEAAAEAVGGCAQEVAYKEAHDVANLVP